ncbi:chorismate mutase [Methylovirgula ligni]|uniref:chorismate mutase n=2 Tax=Methylovirgula ligni TaxID=569860 RepID=A0A3D9Z1L9_9HYPH|nr:chorismate mutase [Methylovirgula ligni]
MMLERRPNPETLADLRDEIDRIDACLHEMLMQRGEIIDRLIAVKARAGGSSAFRPGREADMMRRLVERHKGILPLDTVESIWRIIISTFTFVQANYSVHADISGGDAQMRDCCRFHFGFTVPYVTHADVADVVAAVSAASGDLGLVPVVSSPASGAWWQQLAAPAAPKIIARLPFVERPDHPAATPLFVIAKPVKDGAARDSVLYAATLTRWRDGLNAALGASGAELVAKAPEAHAALLAVPGATPPASLREALAGHGVEISSLTEVGSHAARFDFVRAS